MYRLVFLFLLCTGCGARAESVEEQKRREAYERQQEAWWRHEVNCEYTKQVCVWAYHRGDMNAGEYSYCLHKLKEVWCRGVKWMD